VVEPQIAIDALIGGAMPMLISLINQSQWSPRVRGLVALAACLVAATVAELVRGDPSLSDWRTTAVVIFGSAIATYNLWWKPSTLAPTLEAVTTPSRIRRTSVE
jgi:hypothetical protein